MVRAMRLRAMLRLCRRRPVSMQCDVKAMNTHRRTVTAGSLALPLSRYREGSIASGLGGAL
eukprot:15470599-Alexandrium_andersonii.AAC.1